MGGGKRSGGKVGVWCGRGKDEGIKKSCGVRVTVYRRSWVMVRMDEKGRVLEPGMWIHNIFYGSRKISCF